MEIRVHFFSYFKDLTGCPETTVAVDEGATLGELHEQLMEQFPKLRDMKQSTLKAVGVEYQDAAYRMKAGDQVSLFPPVQGG